MDKTETYIKMCEKAEEIQRQWKPQVGDWYRYSDGKVLQVGVILETPEYAGSPSPYAIWLPRQDQLQEMVVIEHPVGIPNASMPRRLTRYIADWYENYPEAYWFTSMEQLWLAFVMKEKCNKVWDGEEWVL